MSRPWDHLKQPTEPVKTRIVPGEWKTNSDWPVTVQVHNSDSCSVRLKLTYPPQGDNYDGTVTFYKKELFELSDFLRELASQLKD